MTPSESPTIEPRARCAADSAPWDRVGIIASTLCLLHCLAVPLLISALTILPQPVAKPAALDAAPPATFASMHATADHSWLRFICCSPQTDRWVHCLALCVVAPVGGIALWSGFERHRSPWGLLLGVPSLLLLVLGVGLASVRPGIELQRTVTLLGSLLLIAAHLCNRHFDRCTHQSPTASRSARESSEGSPA